MLEELTKNIEFAITEEHDDHKKYLCLSDKAKEEGCDEVSGVLQDIAHEEETHANILQYLLKKIGE